MSELDNIRSYDITYRSFKIIIKVKEQINVMISKKSFKINVLDVLIYDKENKLKYSGIFYAHLPKLLSKKDESKLAKILICNINEVIKNNSRYLGNIEKTSKKQDNEVIEKLKDKFIDSFIEKELEKIYLEYLSINRKEDEISYRNYSCFLEIYFNSHPIPDCIKIIYSENERMNMLEFDDIEREIKNKFAGNTYESNESEIFKQSELRLKLEEEYKFINNDLYAVSNLIKKSDTLKQLIDRFQNGSDEIEDLEKTLSNIKLPIFSKDAKNIKNEIYDKKKRETNLSVNIINKLNIIQKEIDDRFHGLIEDIYLLDIDNIYIKLIDLKNKIINNKNKIEKNIENIDINIKRLEGSELDLDLFFLRLTNNK